MAAGMKFDDRARETSTAPGTGNFTMNGAVQGAITFATFMTNTGDYTTYEADNGTAWETGYITKQANGTYARTVKRSTNSNAAVNFSTGTISVSCDLPAWLVDHLNLIEEAVASGTLIDLGIIQSECIQLTGTTTTTSFGSGKNKRRLVRYTGAGITISHQATLLCPGAVDLLLSTNDIFETVSDNSSTPIWRIIWRVPVSGKVYPLVDGTAALPAVTWPADPDTGIYRIGANNVGVSANGAKVLDISAAGLSVTGELTVSGTAWATFVSTLASEAGGAIGSGNTVACFFKQIGKTVFIRMSVTAGGSGIGSATQVSLSLPVAAIGSMSQILFGKNATTTVGVMGDIGVVGASKMLLNVASTGAIGLANGHTVYISGSYEAA